jgi:hypothetical protein
VSPGQETSSLPSQQERAAGRGMLLPQQERCSDRSRLMLWRLLLAKGIEGGRMVARIESPADGGLRAAHACAVRPSQ